MALALRGYYDGSSGRVGNTAHYLTLAGYAGTDEAWQAFEGLWAEMLSRWPDCDYLHMADANALQGQFTATRGWTHRKVRQLIADAVNTCLTQTGWRDFKDQFVSSRCTVNLDDYRRFMDEYPNVRGLGAAAMCAEQVVPIIYRLLPVDPDHPLGRNGTIALYFDRNEPFEHSIRRVWERGKGWRHPGPLQFVSQIGSVCQEQVCGIQAADLLAWHTNRSYTHDDDAAKLFTFFNTPSQGAVYMDYEALVNRYGAFGAEELATYGVFPPRRRPSAPQFRETGPPGETL
jgi:hypothetical protein